MDSHLSPRYACPLALPGAVRSTSCFVPGGSHSHSQFHIRPNPFKSVNPPTWNQKYSQKKRYHDPSQGEAKCSLFLSRSHRRELSFIWCGRTTENIHLPLLFRWKTSFRSRCHIPAQKTVPKCTRTKVHCHRRILAGYSELPSCSEEQAVKNES